MEGPDGGFQSNSSSVTTHPPPHHATASSSGNHQLSEAGVSRTSSTSSISAFHHVSGANNTKETKGDFSMHLFSRHSHKNQAVSVSFLVGRSMHHPRSFSSSSWTQVSPLALTLVPKIDSDKGTFDADFRMILKYQHKPLKDVPSGEWWIPDVFFLNVVEFEEKMDPEFVYDNETHELTLTKHFAATFTFDIDLTRFPYDSQMLSITVRSFMAKLQRRDAKLQSSKSKEWLFGRAALLSSTDESDASSSLSLEIPVARRPQFYIVYIILPLFLITSTSWSSFFIPTTAFDTKLVITTLSFLSVVMFRSATSPLLPRISYMNDMGNYFLVCYFFLFLVEIMNLSVGTPDIPETVFSAVNTILSFLSFVLFAAYTLYFCTKAIFQKRRFKVQYR